MLTGRPYVLADLDDQSVMPDDDLIYDILGGELVVRNVPKVPHGSVLAEVTVLLAAAHDADFGRMFTSTTAVALDYPARGEEARFVSHPDLVFVRWDRIGIIGDRAIEGVPDLIIEILSPSTRGEHEGAGRLREAYEQHGVPHYWLVDVEARTVLLHALIGEPYVGGRYGEPTTLRGGAALSSPLLPGLSVPVARLFRYVS